MAFYKTNCEYCETEDFNYNMCFFLGARLCKVCFEIHRLQFIAKINS